MSGGLGLAATVFGALLTTALASLLWHGERQEHRRRLALIRRRIEKREAAREAEKTGHQHCTDADECHQPGKPKKREPKL